MNIRKILQIIPATGWKAAYTSPGNTPPHWATPLACWVLVEIDDNDTAVVGMVSEGLNTALIFAEGYPIYLSPEEVAEWESAGEL